MAGSLTTPEEQDGTVPAIVCGVWLGVLPKPYYADDWVTLYHADCCEILDGMPEVDAVITDPPYNVGLEYGGGVNDSKTDYAEWCRTWATKLRAPRKAISTGIANMPMWQAMMPPTWWLCWHKPAAMGRCVVGFNNWEPIGLWGKPIRATCDVITATIKPDASVDGHPCPKPLDWAKKQIEMLVPEKGTVLDPFSGTGTVLLAAKELGRKAIGIEINERYCEIAALRMGQSFFAFA